MLNLFDKLLRDFLVAQNIGLTPGQIWFAPPVPNWRSALVNDPNDIALNIYLVDLRENRKLRSNERTSTNLNGVIVEQPVPVRLDCHYVISAWHPGLPPVESTLDEHLLLYNVAASLINKTVLNPSRVYTSNPPPPDNWPPAFFDTDFPMTIGPVEGFPKLSEFWTSMGAGSFWRPILYVVVTLPVELVKTVAGPMVTTRIIEYHQAGDSEMPDVWIEIGGSVLAGSPPAPSPGVWVQLETSSGARLQTTETDARGRFKFNDLKPGQYQLHARALGKDVSIISDVPSPTGNYDISLS